MRSLSWLRSTSRSLPLRRQRPTPARNRRTRFQLEPLEGKALMTAGALDATFGTGGRLVSDAVSGGALATQADGKIVVAGAVFDADGQLDAQVSRLNPDGTPDTSFGTGGRVIVDSYTSNSAATAVAIQPDGKIVAAGQAPGNEGSTNADFLVMRFNPDGSFDTTFGTGGRATVNLSTFAAADAESVRDVVVQPDGKIVLGGSSAVGVDIAGFTVQDFALVRFNPDGILDTGFDTNGKVHTGFGSGESDVLADLALQADGKIVAAGYAYNGITRTNDFGLVRYTADGKLDTTFGAGGKVTTDFGTAPNPKKKADIGSPSEDEAAAVVIQPDGKIVAAGHTYWSSTKTGNNFALARYNSDGKLDTTFDADGKVTTDFGTPNDYAQTIALETVGGQLKIVVGGYAGSSANADFALARYNLNGSLDTTFDGDGRVVTAFGPYSESISTIVIQPDGKILVMGYTYNGRRSSLALARYLAV